MDRVPGSIALKYSLPFSLESLQILSYILPTGSFLCSKNVIVYN